MNVTNMSIATRLNLAFGCLLLCLFTINGVGLLQLSDLKTVNQNSLATNLPSVMKSQEILENSWEIERALRDIALANEAQPSAKEIQQINAKQQEISVILDKFATLEQTDESKRLLQNMLDARLKYVVGVEQILQRYSENRRQMGIGLILLNFREVQQDYAQSIKAYIRYHSSKFIAANAHINEAYSNTSNWLLASLGGATVLSLVLSWAISSNIHNHVA
ncbi:MAG: MCP four helix bundle domain-containing protein, partial [Burkholderiales bacterium]|nr:MCP four helix bundle domain-containing protein [Burkholderiales bacterium]